MPNEKTLSLPTLFAVFIAALGGLLFGYHTAIISGTLNDISSYFSLTLLEEGLAVSMVLLGALVGSLFAGRVADHFGRKKILLASAVVFCLSSLLLTFAPTYFLFILGRFISGLAVGTSSIVAPLYLGEIAPAHFRGRFVSFFQFMIAAGILLAYAINYLFLGHYSWRIPFLFSLIPSLIQLIGLFFLGESLPWIKNYQAQLSHACVEKRKNSDKKISIRDPILRKILSIGLLLSIFQQITGINTVIYYAPQIFDQTLHSSQHALMATLIVGIVNILLTLLAICFLDHLGRRLFLLIGSAGMFFCQVVLVIAFLFPSPIMSLVALIGTIAYVGFFAIGLGPITWVILAEIFPIKIRGRAIGIAIFANWLCNYIIALTFLLLIKKVGTAGAFSIYGVISLAAFLFIYFYIPETKGKSLEEIERAVVLGKI